MNHRWPIVRDLSRAWPAVAASVQVGVWYSAPVPPVLPVPPPQAQLDAAAAAASAAYHVCPSWDVLVPALMEGGVEGLEQRCARPSPRAPNPNWQAPQRSLAGDLP